MDIHVHSSFARLFFERLDLRPGGQPTAREYLADPHTVIDIAVPAATGTRSVLPPRLSDPFERPESSAVLPNALPRAEGGVACARLRTQLRPSGEDDGQGDRGLEVPDELVIPCRRATPVLQMAKRSLDHVAAFVAELVEWRQFLARRIGLDHRLAAAALDFWDVTSVGALEGVVTRMRRHRKRVSFIGLNQASATLVDRYGPLIQANI